jgi:hypothetical protein
MRLDALGSFTGPRDLGAGVFEVWSRLRYPPTRNTSVRRTPSAIMAQSPSVRDVLGSGRRFRSVGGFTGDSLMPR